MGLVADLGNGILKAICIQRKKESPQYLKADDAYGMTKSDVRSGSRTFDMNITSGYGTTEKNGG